jgi:AcrR family transcriptional regulator
MTTDAVPLDRSQRRRQETIEEVLDIAAEIMTEQGVAGLSLGEVARRMGIRPPSLYVYFPSKDALYDAVFERGARAILDEMRAQTSGLAESDLALEEILRRSAEVMIRWSVHHSAYTQLLFWRPVPGFSPSDQAYAAAVELVDWSRQQFTVLQQRGLFRADVGVDVLHRDWTIWIAGVVSQQLSNAPDEPFDDGRFTAAIPAYVAMFTAHYAAVPSAPTRGSRRARKR